jgi:hypothetical protein
VLPQGAAVAAGDPGKVAQVVLEIAAMDDPPVRLAADTPWRKRYGGLRRRTVLRSRR